MTLIGNQPCPVAMAKQRARAAMALGAVSFVAIGAIAWIGLETVRAPETSTQVSSSALLQDTASPTGQSLNTTQILQGDDSGLTTAAARNAPLSRAEQEKAAARKAILQSAGTNLELLDLDEVEQLTGIAAQSVSKIEAARLAILRNAANNLELLSLREVEELTGYASRTTDPASAASDLAAATPAEPTLDPNMEEIRFLAVEGGLQPSTPPEETVVVSNQTPTAATQVASTDCVAELRNFATSQTILFASGSAELQADELPTLRKIGKMAEGCDRAFVQVTGHSDSSGTDIINLALSWQRADNTVATLAALGIDTAKFEPVGFGARAPSSQGDSSDEERNRRVEFVIFENAGQAN